MRWTRFIVALCCMTDCVSAGVLIFQALLQHEVLNTDAVDRHECRALLRD
jgi:hypothetical protein